MFIQSKHQVEMQLRLYKSLLPLIFAPPGHCCVSVAFCAVLTQVMLHRESGPAGQPSDAEGFIVHFMVTSKGPPLMQF